MFILRLKNFITVVFALMLSLFLVFALTMGGANRFSALDGERVFYLYSASSQAVIKGKITPLELFWVRGECVTMPCQNKEEKLQEILKLYNASVLFEESVGGTHSYYCRTQNWGQTTSINGVGVNLHIAFDGELCVVGAPLIFGGF